MRTTITIQDDLYRQAKARAAASGRSVGELIEDALRTALTARPDVPMELEPLPVHGGSGLMPGVVLDSHAALLDLLDEAEQRDALR